MKPKFYFGVMVSALIAAGCSAYQLGSDFTGGRQDLLRGKSEAAVERFQQAADQDPNYTRNIGYMREGIWTYLGRANYDAGKLPAARQALERAVAQDDLDYLAKLYLGLTLARAENREQAAKNIESGLQGLHEWFQFTKRNAFYGQYWDPTNTIGSEISQGLAMLSRSEIDWPKLISSGEWIGKKTEEEIDLARRDERRQYDRDRRRRR